ncbi:hypothetical protein psal_cds_1258 [Pandoravirus salinus]|uniref:Ankyrin repeat domain containing protein n=1 Tax=Pandoravirus salinus TaxID=1349410 RepID=S4VY48_9VIRU|nr:hypothetical protein psal_cds_1258 [Pandoravirus salinus]AGO85599.1 hypothetical protein psal_cds_1258 [Pandoravirus salinus]
MACDCLVEAPQSNSLCDNKQTETAQMKRRLQEGSSCVPGRGPAAKRPCRVAKGGDVAGTPMVEEEETEGTRAIAHIQLADLPVEVRAAIFSHVDEARDMAAVYFAHADLLVRPLVVEVADRIGIGVVRRAIAAGASLPAVLCLGARVGMDDRLWKHAARGLLCDAVCGGHLDVARWLCVAGDITNADPSCGAPDRGYFRFPRQDANRDRPDGGGDDHGDGDALSNSIIEDDAMAAAACDGTVVAWAKVDKISARTEALWCFGGDPSRPTRTEVHLAAALGMAVEADRGDLVRCLLDHWPMRSTGKVLAERLPKLFERAVRAGSVSVVEALHGLSCEGAQAQCACPVDVGKIAVQCGRVDVIRWLSAAGCRAAPPPTLSSIETALEHGHASVVRWACARIRKPLDSALSPAVLARAAERGHVEALVHAHRLGAIVSTRAIALAAARHNQVRVLRWIAGEEPPGPPLDGWAEPRLGHAAVGSPAVIGWMLTRADARRLLTVGAARHALRLGHRTAVLLLHRVGMAPLDQWNAVATAMATCDRPDMPLVAQLIDEGALVDVEAMRLAIVGGRTDILKILCSAAALDVIQAAVDDVAGSGRFHGCSAQWLVDNVPGLCLADAYGDSKIVAAGDLRCRCARCRPA